MDKFAMFITKAIGLVVAALAIMLITSVRCI